MFHERMNRRTLLKVAGGLLLVGVTDLYLPGRTGAAMTRMRWVESGVFPDGGPYQSEVFEAVQSYNSIEVIWKAEQPVGSALRFAVRASADGVAWTGWIDAHRDSHVRSLSDERNFAAPVLVAPSRYVQYRVDILPNEAGEIPRLSEVEIGCVDTSPPARFLAEPPPPIDGWIIPRAGWGADESLRYKDGEVIWDPDYQPVEKVIVHHTVTHNQEADPAATMRSIYYYHAVTQGWGDIGYNFLIDWHGNVYEGRFGGANVIGGHALQYNRGSLGVALLGTFTKTDATQASYESLVRVIKTRAPNVDPAGISDFADRGNLPNICGHRDVLETECPGEVVHSRISEIRGWCKGTGPIGLVGATIGDAKAELVSVTFTPSAVYSGTEVRVDAVVRNTGTSTIYTQGPAPGFSYTEGQDFLQTGFEKITGMLRIGVDFEGNRGLPNPFRWGLPGPLKPGESTTVTGFVQLNTIKDWKINASLVQEFVRYQQQNVFAQTIKVVSPPTSPAAQSADPALVYESVTQHNVPRVFRAYWEQNGGLERFGYPLTEPYWERSQTDGHSYMTQYFERARFEHHPEHGGTAFEVLLGLLGRERTTERLGEGPFRPLSGLRSTTEFDFYPETGHTLRAGFRDYWRANGGLMTFGYPISEEFSEVSKTDGKTYVVQYFERTRFEWHPENRGTKYEVLLGHLAREILIDRGWLKTGG